MINSTLTRLAIRSVAALQARGRPERPLDAARSRTEDGFEIAQSMGIALLGLIVAATFAGLLEALGVEIIQGIRDEIGL